MKLATVLQEVPGFTRCFRCDWSPGAFVDRDKRLIQTRHKARW